MLVAVFLAHGDDPFGKWKRGSSFATFSLMLMGTGAGRFSVDKLLVDRLPKAWRPDWGWRLAYAVEDGVHPSQVAFAPSGTDHHFRASEAI